MDRTFVALNKSLAINPKSHSKRHPCPKIRPGGDTCRYTYNFGEKSTDDVGIDVALPSTEARWTTLLTFRHFESLSLAFIVITLVVCSLEVLVDVGERGGAQVVVGHGLNEAFNETPTY